MLTKFKPNHPQALIHKALAAIKSVNLHCLYGDLPTTSRSVRFGFFALAELGALGELLGAGSGKGGKLRVGGGYVVVDDVLGQLGNGCHHLPVSQRLHVGQAGLAAVVVGEAEHVARAAPVAVAAGGNGLKHRLRDLRGGLRGQGVGELDASGVVGGLLQLGLHAVEGGDVGLLPAQRLFAGEAHGEEHEAFSGHAVGSATLYTLAVGEVHVYLLKIEEVILRCTFTKQNTDSSQHVVMALAKELCNLNASGGDCAVVNRKLGVSRDSGCRRTESDVSHGEAPTEQGFEPITQAAKQRWWTVQGWRTGSRTGTPLRVSPHGPP